VHIVAEECAGRVPILAGAAEANVKETLFACQAYADMGVRAVAIVAPFYYKLAPESVYAYFAEIARNSPIDLTLYNIPMFASPIDVPTIRRLADEFPRVIGIKDSSGDLAFMMRMIAADRPNRPDFTFLTGWEAVLVPMLMIGCDGGTHASSNVVPEMTRRCTTCTARATPPGPCSGSTASSNSSTPCSTRSSSPTASAPRPSCAASTSATRLPQTGAQHSEHKVLSDVMQCILADFELVNPPACRMPGAHRRDWAGQAGADGVQKVCMRSRIGVSSD
jgi:hypothetical protein